MTIEMKMLAFSCALGIFNLCLATAAVTAQTGLMYNLSPRDKATPPLKPVVGRLNRSFKNFLETFPIFVAAIFLAQATSRNSEITAIGAQMYLYARVAYIPVYALGIPGLRTLIWLVSVAGICLVLLPLLLN